MAPWLFFYTYATGKYVSRSSAPKGLEAVDQNFTVRSGLPIVENGFQRTMSGHIERNRAQQVPISY